MLGQLLRAGPGRHGRLRPIARLADVKIVKIEGRYWALLQREGLSGQVHVCRRSAGLLFFRVIVGVISTTANEKRHDTYIVAVKRRKLTLVGSNAQPQIWFSAYLSGLPSRSLTCSWSNGNNCSKMRPSNEIFRQRHAPAPPCCGRCQSLAADCYEQQVQTRK